MMIRENLVELLDVKGISVENLDTVMEDNRKKVNETLPKFRQITKIKKHFAQWNFF